MLATEIAHHDSKWWVASIASIGCTSGEPSEVVLTSVPALVQFWGTQPVVDFCSRPPIMMDDG